MASVRNQCKTLIVNADITAAAGSTGDVVPCQGLVTQVTVVNTSTAGIECRIGANAWRFLVPGGSASVDYDSAVAGVALRLVNDGATSASAEVSFQRSSVRRTFNRPPTNDDNAGVGYSVSSVWQAGGKVYQPTVAPDVSSAMWGEVANVGGMFVDVMGAANVATAWGTVAMKQGYTGPAVDISVTISGTPTTFTLSILTNGELDERATRTAVGKADAGTYVTVTKVYDQSGSANDWTSPSAAQSPFFVFDSIEQRWGITSQAGALGLPRTLTAPDTVVVSGSACTTFCYGRGNASAVPFNGAVLYTLGKTSAARYTSGLVTATGRFSVSKLGGVGNHGSTIVPVDMQGHVMMVTYTPTLVTIAANEISNPVTPSYGNDSGNYTGGNMFCYDPAANNSAYSSHIVFGFGIAKVAATAAQAKTLRYASYARFDIRPQVLDQLFMLGDSRTNAAHPLSIPFDNIGHRLAAILGKDFRIYNYGLYGRTCVQMLTDSTQATVPTVVAQYNPASRNYATFLGGVNDASGGATADQTVTNIRACTTVLKSTGFRTLLLNELATSNTGGSVNTKLPQIRQSITNAGAAAMSADAILDLVSIVPLLTSTANTSIYADGLHPTAPADAAVASEIADALLAL